MHTKTHTPEHTKRKIKLGLIDIQTQSIIKHKLHFLQGY